MEAREFYKKYLGIENPFHHQVSLFEKLTSGFFPLVLKAPTGSGKTEAVVAPFLSQFVSRDNTLKWLEENPGFNIKDFKEVAKFVNVLDYRASDYEASDALIDLYECVLYADSAPENIQVREGKPVTLIVTDLPKEGRKKKQQDKNQTLNVDAKACSVSVDIGFALKLQQRIVGELIWQFDGKSFKPVPRFFKKAADESTISPFKTYILPKEHYSEEKGILV